MNTKQQSFLGWCVSVTVLLFVGVLTCYMKWRWGICGCLKPPCNPYPPWHLANTRKQAVTKFFRRTWFKWRMWCWEIENHIYFWTDLPSRWHKWYCDVNRLPR